MTSRVFYEKVGRRYVPVAEYDSDWMSSFPKGSHLVVNRNGGSSRRFDIDPAFAPMIAAGVFAEDKMCAAIHSASEARSKTQPITPEQAAAWNKMKELMGDDLFYVSYPSAYEIAQAGIKAMSEEAAKLLTNPAVKQAYEQFLLVAELSKDSK